MQDRRMDTGHVGCRTGGKLERSDAGLEVCRAGGMQERRDTGKEGFSR